MENIKKNENILDLSENIFEKTKSLSIIDIENNNCLLSEIKDDIICIKKLILGIRYFLDRKEISKEKDYLNYINITKNLNMIERDLEYYFLGKENRKLSKIDGEVFEKMFLTATLLVLYTM